MKWRNELLLNQHFFRIRQRVGTSFGNSLCLLVVLVTAAIVPLSVANGSQSNGQAVSVTTQPPVAKEITVAVEYRGSFVGFYESPRLSVFLYTFHGNQQIVWHHARLFQLDSPQQIEINRLAQRVVQQLKSLTRQHASNKKVSVELMELTRWLEDGHYAKPVPVALDPSGAWVAPSNNPKLPRGRYRLVTPNYSSTVKFVGLGGVVYQPVETQKPVWWLLQNSNVVSSHDVDNVWLIDSLKPPAAINVASWNRDEVYVLAGSLIFVPLDANLLGEEFKQLNNAIAALLSYRMEE